MRLPAALLVVAILSTPSNAIGQSNWVRSTEIFTRPDNAHSRGTIFINTHTGVTNPRNCLAGEWCEVDLSRDVLPDAKAAFLSGILIVTQGKTVEISDLHVSFKSIDDAEECPVPQTPTCAPYIGQTLTVSAGSGARSPMSVWVPLTNGRFFFKWTASTGGKWPEHASYGVNLTLLAWTR